MSEEGKGAESAYLVIGGELQDFVNQQFAGAEKIEFVGVFTDYESARQAWKSRALETVDNALRRYCIIGLDSAMQHARKL